MHLIISTYLHIYQTGIPSNYIQQKAYEETGERWSNGLLVLSLHVEQGVFDVAQCLRPLKALT